METVISLATYNAANKISNAEWESSLSNDVILNDGDTLAVKTVYIDTRTLGSDNIIIEEDTDISIDYYLYYNNCDTISTTVLWRTFDWNGDNTYNNFASSPGMANADGLPYLLAIYWYPYDYNLRTYDVTKPKQWTPVVQTWTMTLKKGAYAKDYLAQLITKNMASVYPTNLDYGVEMNMTFFGKNITDFWSSIHQSNYYLDYVNEYQPNRNFLIQPYYEMGTMYINYGGQDPNNPLPDDSNLPSIWSTKVPAVYVSILNVDKKFNLEQGLAPGSTTNRDGSNAFGQQTIAIAPFQDIRQIMGNSQKFQIPKIYQNNGFFVAGACGASQISLLWNNQGNNIFCWDYIHTPIIVGGKQCVIMEANSVPNSVDIQDQGYQSWAMCDRQCGIIFSGLYPPSFWNDTLGFQNITTNLNANNAYQLSKFDYRGLTTCNYWGLSNLMSTGYTKVGNFDYTFPWTIRDEIFRQANGDSPSTVPVLKVWESDVTNTLDASSPPVNPSDTGHFLLEIQGYTNSFFDEKNSYQVKSIVSNYYISPNSFATAPFPDSFIYEHHGDPMLIRQLKVRILSPKTKQPYPLLGPNSTVYLQLTQNMTPEKEQQPVQG